MKAAELDGGAALSVASDGDTADESVEETGLTEEEPDEDDEMDAQAPTPTPSPAKGRSPAKKKKRQAAGGESEEDPQESTADEDDEDDADDEEEDEEEEEEEEEEEDRDVDMANDEDAGGDRIDVNDGASMLRMTRRLPELEAQRHEQFRRSHFERGAIKRVCWLCGMPVSVVVGRTLTEMWECSAWRRPSRLRRQARTAARRA